MDLTRIVAIPWVLPIICGSIVAIVAIIGGVVSDCVKATSRTGLKRTMVEHGYTAEQIDYVLCAEAKDGK